MTYFNPHKMTKAQRRRIDDWLVANGARWHASADYPVIVKGRWIEYPAICRRDDKSNRRRDWLNRIPDPEFPGAYLSEPRIKRRRVRIRVPLSEIPEGGGKS